MFSEELIFFQSQSHHYYTLACTGLKLKDKIFTSRQSANDFMYKMCKKYGIHVEQIWKDHHDITYCCSNNIKFYVQRA